MNRRGQTTLFIILGVAILILTGLLLYMEKSDVELGAERTTKSHEAEAVEMFMDSCIDYTLKDIVEKVARNGGYYSLPELSTDGLYHNTPYYVYENALHIISIEDIEKNIGYYLNVYVPDCIFQLKSIYEEKGYTIEDGALDSEVKLGIDQLRATVTYPLTLSNEKESLRVEDFAGHIQTQLTTLYNAANEFALTYLGEEPGFSCLSCMTDIASKYDVLIDNSHFAPDQMLVEVKNKEADLKFRFAVKFVEESE